MALYDVVIVGGGVSGLCAAYTFARSPALLKVLVIDKGNPIETRASERYDPDRVAYGAGGAGIINDGKFTAGLAGTHLKPMPGYDAALREVAALIGCDVADLLPESASESDTDTDWHVKKSKSMQLPLADRVALVKRLIDVCTQAGNVEFWWKRQVQFPSSDFAGSRAPLVAIDEDGTHVLVSGRQIILATGRFWHSPNMFPLSFFESMATFRRVEVGIRLEMDPALMRTVTQWTPEVKDPKWVHTFTHDNGIEVEARSFCTCDNGEVIRVSMPYGGNAVSGVSDVAPTGRSNVGINVRVHTQLLPPRGDLCVYRTTLQSLADGQVCLLMSRLDAVWLDLVLAAVQAFLKGKPLTDADLQQPVDMHFWSVEGVGEYPYVTPDHPFVLSQKNNDRIVAVCGDASGIYRGLVQAMVSGMCVARLTASRLIKLQLVNPAASYLPLLKMPSNVPALTCEGKMHVKTVLYESHVFLGPLNPAPEICERYRQCVALWNEHVYVEGGKKMKAPIIGLCVRGVDGKTSYVHVMQSSRYITDATTTAEAVHELAKDRLFWEARGFEILRCKLEASTPTVGNLPRSMDAALKFEPYYETHLKVVPSGAASETGTTTLALPTPDNLETLAAVSARLSTQFGAPVCLSYNAAKDPDLLARMQAQGWAEYDALSHGQRFVNFRMRRVTPEEDERRCKLITAALRDNGWDVIAAIREVVVFQTSQLGDLGWLDPQASTVVLVSGKRLAGKSTFVGTLRTELQKHGVALHEVCLSDPVKEAYCRRYMLDPLMLQGRAQKEKLRAHMQALTDELRAAGDNRGCWQALAKIAELNATTSGVIVVSDLCCTDELSEMRFACEQMVGRDRVVTVRLNASDAERAERGWIPNNRVDGHKLETDLDQEVFGRWDFVRQPGGLDTTGFACEIADQLLRKLWL